MIFGGMAVGVTTVEGLLEGDDVLATARAVEAFGAQVERTGEGEWRIVGAGGFKTPLSVIDCGNAGTGVRLLMGAAAGYPLTATFDGDASLRKRPMKRVTGPLAEMGARFDWLAAEDRVPVALTGGALTGIDYVQTVASAQIKSAILLAGLNAEGVTTVTEPEKSRDHTERMLRAFGAEVTGRRAGRGLDHHIERRAAVEGRPRRRAGRSVVRRLSPGRRADRAGLGSDGRRRNAEHPAHRPVRHLDRDGRRPDHQ